MDWGKRESWIEKLLCGEMNCKNSFGTADKLIDIWQILPGKTEFITRRVPSNCNILRRVVIAFFTGKKVFLTEEFLRHVKKTFKRFSKDIDIVNNYNCYNSEDAAYKASLRLTLAQINTESKNFVFQGFRVRNFLNELKQLFEQMVPRQAREYWKNEKKFLSLLKRTEFVEKKFYKKKN